MRRSWLACVAVLALAPSSSGCEKKAETAAAPPPMELGVAEVIQRDIPVFAEFVGTLDGNVNADIRARVPGVLQSQNYQEGTLVKTGQLLFTIDAKPFEASTLQARGELSKAKASLAKAEADIARYKPLVEKNAISKQELDNAVASRDAAIGQVQAMSGSLEQANLNLGYTKVVSPIDGIAGIAKVRIGNLVGQGEPTLLTTVSNLDPIRVAFSVSEQLYLAHVEKLRKAQAEGRDAGPAVGLELILSNGSVHPSRGKVALADRQVDTSTGTITLQAFFPNPGNLLRPGQYAKVRATTDQHPNAILIPQRAVQELQDRRQVFVVGADNKLEAREVTAGERVGSFWVIESGLKPGEKVVVEGVQKSKPGMAIAPKPFTLDLSSLTPSKDVVPPPAGSAPAPSPSAEPSSAK